MENQVISTAPVGQIQTKRGVAKFILLSIVTLGIYPLVYYSAISEDLNAIAGRYDGKKTMHYCLLFFLIGPITLEIGTLVWFVKMSNRIGRELSRRGIDYSFNSTTFWLWNVLGILIVIGPFVYVHKLSKAMNVLAYNYNQNG